jgi:hypothetical protein
MANRYPGGPPADDAYDGVGQRAPARSGSDPLAELARLIGQTDPFGTLGRANQPAVQHDTHEYDQQTPPEPVEHTPAARPTWMQRVARREQPAPEQDLPSTVHPLRGYTASHAAPEPDYHQAPQYADDVHTADPSRYDDALYGHLGPEQQQAHHDTAYADDPYAYEDHGDEAADHALKKRRGGTITVAVVLALAVLGTGGAFAYRTFIGSPRSGEPPIIKADNTPTKVVPAPSDGPAKTVDRLTAEGSEKIVPREEQPVDVNGAPRVVLQPLVPNPVPPALTGTAPVRPFVSNAVSAVEEPRKIKTFAVKGDQADIAATPAPKPAQRPRPPPGSANANASAGNAPLSLSPQGAPPAPEQRRAAASPPAQSAAGGGSGGYVVQVASQRNEGDAQASYRALQGKYPSVLGSRTPVIKRADLGDKGVFYRAMIGPFESAEDAAQLCGSLKTAGGQCVVQRN